MNDLDVVGINADLVRDDLREGGFLALSVRRGSNEDVDLAGRVEANDRAFPEPPLESDRSGYLGGAETADFHIGGHAYPEMATVLVGRGLRLPQLGVAHVVQAPWLERPGSRRCRR